MKKLRVAVLGYGYWGPNLVRNLYNIPDCEMVAVADRDQRQTEAVRKLYPVIETANEADEVICREDIDAVVVATPPSTHYPLAKKALMAGKHVLVEKPLTRASCEAEELVQIAKESNLTLMVDHTFIYSGAVRKIRDIIDSGELGDILYIDSVRINLGIFQQDVSVIEDLAPHDISIFDYLLNAKPVSVSATGIAPVSFGNHTPDSLVYGAIQYDSGVLAHFHLSWLSPVKIRRMLIGGTKKTVVYDHLEPDNQIMIYEKGLDLVEDGNRKRLLGERRLGDMYAPKVDQTEPLERLCNQFVKSALNGHSAPTDGDAGLRVVRVLESLNQSMRQNGAVIPL